MRSSSIILFFLAPCTNGFVSKHASNRGSILRDMTTGQADIESTSTTRRGLLVAAGVGALTGVFGVQPQSALAIVAVTFDEFGIILRDSPLSIQVVEFSGSKSETIVVRLVDGTSFGIKDMVESSTDPRSPLKVSAACRENNVKTKFVDLEALLSTTPKKKKLYTNQRVQDAAEKNRERQERMDRDEEERVAALRSMEQE